MNPPDAPSPTVTPGVARTLARHPRPLGGDTARSVGPAAVSLTGFVLNNVEKEAQTLRIGKKPDWLRARMPGGEGFRRMKSIIDEHRLHTVCEEASCPNIGECWARGAATIMILGDTCTRSCGFCNVKTGRPAELDLDEPRRVAESLRLVGLKHVVITSVNRDELPDGGAAIWAETIERVHEACPEMSVEVLVGDFCGDEAALQKVIDARPEILSHNMETVRRMHPAVRPQARYERSLRVLQQIQENGLVTKTGIMLGIGEHEEEVLELMDDLQRWSRADILTIGQYLQPTRNHLPIARWVHPDEFERHRSAGLAKGFKVVESGPLVRSSYHADEQASRLAGPRGDAARAMDGLLAARRQQRS
jgi:lipoic acid synthetase